MKFYKIKKLILNHSSGVKVLVLFGITMAVYALMLLFSIPKVHQFAGGMRLPDMMPEGYDFEYIMNLFSALGDNGRSMYLSLQLPIDMIYPALFAICYSLMLAYFLKKLRKEHSLLLVLCFLPFVAGVADYFENIGIIYMLKQFPDLTEQTVDIVSGFSVIKSTATSIYFAVLILMLVVLGVQQIKWKK